MKQNRQLKESIIAHFSKFVRTRNNAKCERTVMWGYQYDKKHVGE